MGRRSRAERGEFRVFNQFTEQFSVAGLAELVRSSAERLGYAVEIRNYVNPRVEKEEHYYNAIHTKLLDLGLQPTMLAEELVASLLKLIDAHKDRVIDASIEPHTRWSGPDSIPVEGLDDDDERDLVLQS